MADVVISDQVTLESCSASAVWQSVIQCIFDFAELAVCGFPVRSGTEYIGPVYVRHSDRECFYQLPCVLDAVGYGDQHLN